MQILHPEVEVANPPRPVETTGPHPEPPSGELRVRREVHQKAARATDTAAFAAALPRSVDLAPLLHLARSAKYRVEVLIRQRGDSRYVACVGQMLTPQGTWMRARSFNFAKDELDSLIEALQRAKALLK